MSAEDDGVTVGQEDLNPSGDVEMVRNGDLADANDGGDYVHLRFDEADVLDQPTSFIQQLTSPIVTLIIGRGSQTTLSAHQLLLAQSSFFKAACSAFVDDESACMLSVLRIGNATGAVPV